MNWSNSWNTSPVWPQPKAGETIIIGVDKGSPDGDVTIVGLTDGKVLNIIGESVELSIPIAGQWPRKVRAIQVGDLAVHEQLPNSGMQPYKWQITHVPTLTMFDRVIPDGDWTQEQLINWCHKVQQQGKEHWEALKQFNNNNYDSVPKYIVSEIQDICLSILPEE